MEEKIKCILITCVERELSAQECDDLEAGELLMTKVISF